MSGPPPILGSMRADGSRLKVHPADVRGKWLTARRVVFVVLIAVYVLAPFIPIGGHPAIQLDVEHRRFYLLGNTFNAQDFWMMVLIILTFVFALLFLTAWRGRVWCGWACPQTVFLEGVYRPIERFFEGSRDQRLRLDKEPWGPAKAARFAAKHLTFLAVSVLIAHTATALFVSPKELALMIREGPALHLEAFLLTLGFTAILTFNFSWFREQFCIVLCPYGRLQSVLHDRDSITVAYDEKRGEPRGGLKKNVASATPRGDCVDCYRCVVVCPTAIDIRSGLQMECLACLQCVDACDEVMTKIGKPTGLIGLYSQNQQSGKGRHFLRPRMVIYGLAFLLASSVLTASLVRRTPFEANLLRPRGSSPFFLDGEMVRNSFEIHLVNKRAETTTFRIEVLSPVEASVVIGTPVVELASLADTRIPISVSIEREDLPAALELRVRISDTQGDLIEKPMRFLAPPGRH